MKPPNFSFIFYKFHLTSYNFYLNIAILAYFCYFYAKFFHFLRFVNRSFFFCFSPITHLLYVEIQLIALMTLCYVCDFEAL